MFTGFHELTIDEKNRLSIPASIRAALEEAGESKRLYLVPGEYKRTLVLVPEKEFDSTVRSLRQPQTGDKASRTRSLFIAAASPLLEIDKHGRVLLPNQHLVLGGIEREILMIGHFNRLVIMNREEGIRFMRVLWESRQQELDSVVAENPAELGRFWEGFGKEQLEPEGDSSSPRP